MVWYSHLSKSFPQFVMIHTKALASSMKQRWMFFLKLCCFLYNPVNVGNLISGSSSFSKPSLDIRKFLVCIMLKPSMQDFKHDLTSTGDECQCLMVSKLFVQMPIYWDQYNIFKAHISIFSYYSILSYSFFNEYIYRCFIKSGSKYVRPCNVNKLHQHY